MRSQITLENTCLPILRSRYKNLTKSEQKIADYILEYPKEVMGMTISELAENAGSAEITVSRFCHKLGFNGFQRLKQALAGDIFSPVSALSKEVDDNDTMQGITQSVFLNTIEALQNTSKMLNYLDLEKAVTIISKSKRIDAYGYGGSGIIAQDIEHRFMRFGLQIHSYTDPHLQIASAALLGKNDTVIAISHTGASADMLSVLEVAKNAGAKIIVITSYVASPVTKYADVILAGIAEETTYRSEAMASRLVHLSIVDTLYSGVIQKCTEPFVSNMAKVRAAIAKEKV